MQARLFIITLFCLILLDKPYPSLQSQTIDAPSFPVHSVQFYTNQAEVTRQSEVSLQPGINRIEIDNLTSQMLDDTIRVSIPRASNSTMKIQTIEVESDYIQIYKTEEAKSSELMLSQAESKLRNLSDQFASLQEEERSLKSIQVGRIPDTKSKSKDSIGEVSPNNWISTLNFIQTSLEKNHDQMLGLLDQIDKAREELSIAIFISEKYKSGKSISKKKITVEIYSKDKSKETISLSYRMFGASWYPVYSARVFGEGSRSNVHFNAYALIQNESGEDWNNAKVSFSAANPSESAQLPSLKIWKIESRIVDSTKSNDSFFSSKSKRLMENSVSPAPAMEAMDREEAMPIASKNESPKSASIGKKDMERQRSISQQANQSQGYYNTNIAQIPDARANKKTSETQKVLNNFQQNIVQRDNALRSKDYDNALHYSERILENINSLEPKFKKYFTEELIATERAKRQSLEMQEKRQLISRLIPPKTGSFDFNYSSQSLENIPSDGAFRKIFLYEKDWKVDLNYEASPITQKTTFLAGNVKFENKIPLLSGPVTIFYENDYIGESVINDVSIDEPFTLQLGAIEDVQIKRTEDKFREKSGLLSKSFVNSNTITIQIKNRKKNKISIDVFDRIPISTDERVQITDIKISSNPDETYKSYGMYKFKLNLDPGTEQKITIQYKMIHPENIQPVFNLSGSPQW
ncbi:mucoidy inhibitor MuiA family protein [Leptospira sp. GIMC2001]|uniref:mucoidy inhibitor MuiA family protein n=1 Tax=Leptospira sp. GIMC2001 TaxID=1513297 RepID=UPI00234BF7AD|nr:mucoidy inhibitor MuiA family protein [Leptospira sp. GIMC2001]WCL49379.1 mucoidy inhibitor MuiA family protein [Leptospira sp. GIMC2001]